MLYWIIQTTILSIIFIFVVHYLINFFKSTLTVPKIKDLILMLTTFMLTTFAWIFFRAENIAHALDYEKNGSSDHGDRWRTIATSIGCNADMKTSSKTSFHLCHKQDC